MTVVARVGIFIFRSTITLEEAHRFSQWRGLNGTMTPENSLSKLFMVERALLPAILPFTLTQRPLLITDKDKKWEKVLSAILRHFTPGKKARRRLIPWDDLF